MERYVATSTLARGFQLHSASLSRYRNDSGMSLLAIPKPATGRGHAFFLPRNVPAQIQLPSPQMLRKQAELRMQEGPKEAVGRLQAGQGNGFE